MASVTCKVLVPLGALGAGFPKADFENGLALGPDIIAADAGSTDSGPYYLGTGKSKYAREVVKRDMALMILGGQRLRIPVAIGTAGTCGTDSGVDWLRDICLEICEDHGLSLKMALIYSEQDREDLRLRWLREDIRPLWAAPSIDESTFVQCSHIVALAGAEPFIAALEAGADLVICGRATDTAILAAMPLMRGCAIGASWHAAKTAECGALCTTNPSKGGVFFTVDETGFTIRPMSEEGACTPYSVAAHMLYENADPYILTEPSGRTIMTDATYTQVDGRTVRVEGTRFEAASRYSMKLEGSSIAGYQTITLTGIADPRILASLDRWEANLRAYVGAKLKELDIAPESYSYDIRYYGRDAVAGLVPGGRVPGEVGLLFVCTGRTQELATKVAKVFNPYLLHFPLEETDPLPSFAFAFSPAETERGPVYEFRLNHVVLLEDPLELVRISYLPIEGGKPRRAQ